jgi:hypothetical protein
MRMIGVVLLFIVFVVGPASAAQDILKDPEGATFGVLLDCSECKEEKDGAGCARGVEAGFHDGRACGKCLMEANFGTKVLHAYDVLFLGYLKDEDGNPVKGRFVRIFMPNTWSVRTRTGEDGLFRLMLGATLERKSKDPLVIDLGTRTIAKGSSSDSLYAMYLLPENYKPCPK